MIEFGIGFLVGIGFAAVIAMAWMQSEESRKKREDAMVERLTEELSKRQK